MLVQRVVFFVKTMVRKRKSGKGCDLVIDQGEKSSKIPVIFVFENDATWFKLGWFKNIITFEKALKLFNILWTFELFKWFCL